MNRYLYILGRTPELAFSELQTFLPDVTRVQPDVARSSVFIPIDRLGGTVKIAEVVRSLSIAKNSTFGISVYGGEKIPRKTLEELKRTSGAARFVEPHEGPALSTVVVAKNRIDEFILAGDIVAKTVAVQPFEEWSRRDFGRPNSDPRSGMLPPKVARMVVNIAGAGNGKTLLDPFCGMGTVMVEGALSGWRVIGSDQSPDVVAKARENLDWAGVTGYTAFVSDATHVSEHLPPASVDAIVTEPFMGKQVVSYQPSVIRNLIRGLEKLYIGCLKDWRAVLKNHGVVVIALPQYSAGGKTYFVKKVIDMCEILGYTTLTGPIEYGREHAVVKRVFYKLQSTI